MDVRIADDGYLVVIDTDIPPTTDTIFDYSSLIYYACMRTYSLEYLGPRITDPGVRVDIFSYDNRMFALTRWDYRADTFGLVLQSVDNNILNETEPLKNFRYKVIHCVPATYSNNILHIRYFKEFTQAQEYQKSIGKNAVIEEI